MQLSLSAIKLCQKKNQKNPFVGFSSSDLEFDVDYDLPETKKDIEDLFGNGLLENNEGKIRISARGNYIFDMMMKPDHYVIITNKAKKLVTRTYIKDVDYLCIIEDLSEKDIHSDKRFSLHVLSKIDMVVGSFVRGLHINKEIGAVDIDNEFTVNAKSVDLDGTVFSMMNIKGSYSDGEICYIESDDTNDEISIREESDYSRCNESALINKITEWLFANMSQTERERVS